MGKINKFYHIWGVNLADNNLVKKNNKIGYIAAVLSAICFGSAGLFVKYIYSFGLSAGEMLILQYLIAVVVLWIGSYYIYGSRIIISSKLLKKVLILGVFGNTFMTLFYYKSFMFLDVAVATILLFTYPILVTIYSFVFGNEKFDKIILFSLIIAFAGSFLVLDLFNYNSNVESLGVIFGILGAVFYAFMNVYSESFLDKIEPIILTAYVNTFSLITLIIYYRPFHLFNYSLETKAWLGILMLAIIAGVLPVALLYTGIKNIGAVKASIIANFEIPVSAILSYLVYNERLNFFQMIGMFLVLIGIIILQNKDKIIKKIRI